MDPLLVVWGITIALGSIYWWQQKVVAVMGDSGVGQSFPCLVTAGMSNCSSVSGLEGENWLASVVFYLGLVMLAYTLFFHKPPRTPPSVL